jgi:SAM-dependent methyltransferase
MTVLFCQSCSLMQLLETVNPTVLFATDYPFFSSVSEAWLAHARANVSELIDRRQLGPSSLAVEIGSNDGYLLRNYVERGVPAVGIDPAEGPSAAARALGITVRQEFFGCATAHALVAERGRADVVHANNVFAHVSNLNDVVDGIGLLLKDDGVAVIEVPYVRDLVDHCEFDTIYHEHLCYFSVTSASRLFQKHGLVLADVRRLPTYGGSLRFYVQRTGEPSPAVLQLLREEEEAGLTTLDYYSHFAQRARLIQRSLKDLLRGLKAEGKRIAAYGVAAKAAVIFNAAGISDGEIDYAVDRSRHKQGKFVPGVHFPIFDTTRLLEDSPPDYLLLCAWNFKDEIMQQQHEYARRGGKFIVPIPVPEIVA